MVGVRVGLSTFFAFLPPSVSLFFYYIFDLYCIRYTIGIHISNSAHISSNIFSLFFFSCLYIVKLGHSVVRVIEKKSTENGKPAMREGKKVSRRKDFRDETNQHDSCTYISKQRSDKEGHGVGVTTEKG